MEWYYFLGIVSYGIFIIQFLLSNFGFIDSDLDIDLDGDADFSVSDLVSFKGLIHFVMGLSGWLMLSGRVTTIDLIIAVVVGFIFVIVLYYLYKLCMKFSYEPTKKVGMELIGSSATVYIPGDNGSYLCILPDSREIVCKCYLVLKYGDIVTITGYNNGIYQVSPFNFKL